GSNAYGGYADLDDLFHQQARERDPGKREALLHRIQQISIDRVMFAPIMDYRTLRGVGPRIAEHMLDSMHLIPFPAYEEVRRKDHGLPRPAGAAPAGRGRRDDLQSAAHLDRAVGGGLRRAPRAVSPRNDELESAGRRAVPGTARRARARAADRPHHRRGPEPERARPRGGSPPHESGDDDPEPPAGGSHRPAGA